MKLTKFQSFERSLLADKAYDADERVRNKLKAKNCTAIIPCKSTRKQSHTFDRIKYQARHLIENFFAKLKQYRAIATRYDMRIASRVSNADRKCKCEEYI